jgi:hypothetical protein
MEVKATVDEAVGIGKEIYGFWGKLAKMFGGNPATTQAAPKPLAKKKAFVAVDETKVMADIVSQLTEFFKLQEQLADHITAEEEKSKNVYDPNANLMEAALKRVMAQDQMAALEVTIREMMVYQSPPEMGALYSKVFEMRDIIKQEQENSRLKEEAKERYRLWQRREAKKQFLLKEAYLAGTAIFLLYIWMWFLYIKK